MLFFLNIINQNKKNLSAMNFWFWFIFILIFSVFYQYYTLIFKNLKFNIF